MVVSTGGTDMVVSTLVLSEPPETFFVELHAEMAIVKVPATARLKISFFIRICFKFNSLTILLCKKF
ncbi:hypothetical protein D3C86_2089930 [compost metagenome]